MKKMGVLMQVYVWEHMISLYYRTARWIFTKLGNDEVFMAVHIGKGVSAISTQGRIKARLRGGPFLQKTSSSHWKANKPNAQHHAFCVTLL